MRWGERIAVVESESFQTDPLPNSKHFSRHPFSLKLRSTELPGWIVPMALYRKLQSLLMRALLMHFPTVPEKSI
jgi:hypothetical protein